MSRRDGTDNRRVTEAEADELLRRASILDVRDARVQLQHVREAALEAGLSAEAVSMAEREVFNRTENVVPPDWVRFSFLGVPNRAAAQFWYQLLCAAGLACGSVTVLLPGRLTPGLGFTAALWFFGCAVLTARAIGWMDQHNAWNRV